MNKTIVTSIFTAVLAMSVLTALAENKTWRINSNTTMGADFASINAAMSSDAVTAGDILYLDPGCLLSSKQTVTKQVTIIGTGYFRNNSPHQFATISGDFQIEAAGTEVEGVILKKCYVYARNVIFERCKIIGNLIIGASDHDARNATIRQCFFSGDGRISGYNNKTSSYSSVCTIENCILIPTASAAVIANLYIPTIRNNYVKEGNSGNSTNTPLANIEQGFIKNNVLFTKEGVPYILNNVTNSVISHNIMSCSETQYPEYAADNYFLNSADESLVFALEGADDQLYQLKTDSPAKGYADEDGDCGPFGGTNPYVLNGLPAHHPYYTKAVIGSQAKDGKVNVSLNIKMQDE